MGLTVEQPTRGSAPPQASEPNLPLDIPPSLSPLVVVVLSQGEAPDDSPTTPLSQAVRCGRAVARSGQWGADLKEALREGLHAGARCVVAWPGELGDWHDTAPRLALPIFARRADIVLAAWTAEARAEGLSRLPAWPARRLLGDPPGFIHQCPVAMSRRAIDVVPFEANCDRSLFELQLLAQARHFGLDLATVPLSPGQCRLLSRCCRSRRVGLLAQTGCALEGLMHRWGLIDSPRFQAPQLAWTSRWMIAGDRD